ncbi:probable inactive peptidyl-prolyl cis-trans isomerase-like 6 isoform X2 [Leucoraja erinacea]|uniref:probable inactive peptidyl-prolyl cis-trans isomerase-like 6 isoform X2 n=1 Tax=Leucoraja erinaceus TaxID=7782 RepID=UPI0024565C21|nr:probable inactive peptidyl-prolyl cis-trans isomerase-like 6 isoform X2 [Leucoraja erinacea]
MSPSFKLEVVGLVQDPRFHTVTVTAQVLKLGFPSRITKLVIRPLLEFAWDSYLAEMKKMGESEVWGFTSCVMCFLDGQLLGDEKDFLQWARVEFAYTDYRPQSLYRAITDDFHSKYLKNTKHIFVYLEIAIDQQPVGKLLLELFTDKCPKTCKNFETLCTAQTASTSTDSQLCYKGTIFHRLVKNGWIQGGDVLSSRGDGGKSIYGETFNDENFAISHCKRGVLGMANRGPHTNASQFYITLQPALWMNTRFVSFGHLIAGTDVLEKMESIPTYNERPTVECKITDCGYYVP